MRSLVAFGSKADDDVVQPIVAQLKKSGFEVQVEYVSAHRQPERLDQLLSSSTFDLVVAGAGLAAHLPGVVASKTLKPVVGVPVQVAFGGFDALMSIVQMPPGIPVFTVPPLNAKNTGVLWGELARLWSTMDKLQFSPDGTLLHFVGDPKIINGDLAKKARAILDAAGVSWSVGKKPKPGICNIFILPKGHISAALKIPKNCLPIFVPVFNKTGAELKKPNAAVTLLKNIGRAQAKGFWVGANNFVNAVCGGLQIYNASGRYNALLTKVKKGEFHA